MSWHTPWLLLPTRLLVSRKGVERCRAAAQFLCRLVVSACRLLLRLEEAQVLAVAVDVDPCHPLAAVIVPRHPSVARRCLSLHGPRLLGRFGRDLQLFERVGVVARVDAFLGHEAVGQHVEDAVIEVVAAEEGVATRREHFENVLTDLENRNIERASAEVVDCNLLFETLAKAIGECCGGGFVEDAKDLEARNPGQFSRIWLEPVPARAGVIEFVGDVPSESPPNGVTLLGQGKISQGDHERRAELVAQALLAKDITNFTSFFDAPSGKIVVEMNEQTGQTDNSLIAIIAVAAITESSELGGEARSMTAEDLDVRRGTAFETDYSRGGENMTDGGSFECTSGWAVEGPDGDGIVTAAHCTGLDGLNHTPSTVTYFHNTTWRDEERGQGDSEYHTTTNLEVPEFSARDGEIRDVLSKKSTFWILPGQSICRYGRSSDFRDCSHTVLAKNVTATFTDGVTVSRLVQADGDSAIGGDSGGGWSWGSKAWGVHSGSNGTTSVFTPIGRVERELAVDLMIHP